MKNKKTITLLFEIIMLLNFIFYLITKDNMFVVAMIFCGIEMICNWLSMIHAKPRERFVEIKTKPMIIESHWNLKDQYNNNAEKISALGRSFYE